MNKKMQKKKKTTNVRKCPTVTSDHACISADNHRDLGQPDFRKTPILWGLFQFRSLLP